MTQPTLCFFGAGPRRWQLLGQRPAGVARVLWPVAVRERQVVAAPHPQALRDWLGWVDAGRQRGLAVAALVSYEAGVWLQPRQPPAIEQQIRPQPSVPLAWGVAFDPADLQDAALPHVRTAQPDLQALAPQQAQFVARVRDALERIAAGEIYQVNLTTDVVQPAAPLGHVLQLCAQVMAVQAVPFGVALHDRDFAVVSG